jgi:hypothetical protein
MRFREVRPTVFLRRSEGKLQQLVRITIFNPSNGAPAACAARGV